jgi:putative aminopeptidase FrvX
MPIDHAALTELCDLVSVATACSQAVNWVRRRLPGWETHLVDDGFLLAMPPGARPEGVRVLFVSHVDEIGGYVLGPHPSGGHRATPIGVPLQALSGRFLQCFDWLDVDGSSVRPIEARVEDDTLLVFGKRLQSYATAFTYLEPTRIEGEWIIGKALDPRLTAYAVTEAARRLADPEVAVMLVFAEECSIHAAEKGAAYARRRMGGLRLVVNCDVPGLANIEGWPLEQCGIRITEGGRLMDPSSALRVHGELVDRGIPIALGASRTGSQTPLFIPQCRAISLALPAEEAHVTPTRAYLPALETLIRALEAIPGTSPAR